MKQILLSKQIIYKQKKQFASQLTLIKKYKNMNQLQKQAPNAFSQHNTQPSRLSSLVDINDPNRQKPNLLRINADNQDKKFVCVLWTIIIIFIIVLAIISKALPPAIKPITNSGQLSGTNLNNCTNPNTFDNGVLQCGSFVESNPVVGVVVQGLSSLNQFVAFWLLITPKNLTTALVLDQNVTYLLYGLQQQNVSGQTGYAMIGMFENETVPFQYTSQSTSYMYDDNQYVTGYKAFIGFIGQFPANNLMLALQFNGPFDQFANVSSIEIQGYKISKGFTRFTIAVRYIFFVLSLLAAFLYIRKYRKIPDSDRIIEQKLIGILSIFLIFFNDPFYPITVLKQNMARYLSQQKSSFFSTLFVVAFIVYLIFLWVIFFDRILYQEGRKDTDQIKLYKILYAFLLFVLLMILYMLYAAYRLNEHPFVPRERLNDKNILIMDVLTSICFILVMAYIIVRFVSICSYKQDRLWRSELFMAYSILFMTAMAIFILTDNALGSFRYDGTTVLFSYGLMNFYTWYLQYMYSPSKQTVDQLNEKRSLHSDEIMTAGNSQFNDLNINLDEYYPQFYNEPNPKKNLIKPDENQWGRNKNDNLDEDNQRKFSIDQKQNDEAEGYGNNNYNKNKQPPKVGSERVDFFSEDNIHKFNIKNVEQTSFSKQIVNTSPPQPNSTNLLSLSGSISNPTQHKQQIEHPQQSQFSSEANQDYLQVDQQNLEIISEQSQRPNDEFFDENEKKQQVEIRKNPKEEGFGEFQFE